MIERVPRRTFLKATAAASLFFAGAGSVGGCGAGQNASAQCKTAGVATAGSTIRYRADGPVILLGAHCDDVPFHCWHYLTKVRPVAVVDMFMGIPPAGTMATDALKGPYEVGSYMRERHAEEREALARAGVAPPRLLSGLDMPYRGDALPNLGTLATELAKAMPEASLLVAPLGLGNRIRVGTPSYSHVDHKYVRDVADSFPSVPKMYYAEVYALSKRSSDYDELLEHMRAYAHWRLKRVDLTRDEIVAKRGALQSYRSQMAGLLADIPDILSDGFLGTELYWSPT